MKNLNVILRLAPNCRLGRRGGCPASASFLRAPPTSAILDEGVGYVVLLIPRRIKKLKDEGRREGFKRGIEQGLERGLERGRREERERVGKAVARFKRGEISIDELRRLIADQD